MQICQKLSQYSNWAGKRHITANLQSKLTVKKAKNVASYEHFNEKCRERSLICYFCGIFLIVRRKETSAEPTSERTVRKNQTKDATAEQSRFPLYSQLSVKIGKNGIESVLFFRKASIRFIYLSQKGW